MKTARATSDVRYCKKQNKKYNKNILISKIST